MPNTWYPIAALFDHPGVTLKDGSTIRASESHFSGAPLQMLTGRVRAKGINLVQRTNGEVESGSQYVQVTLMDVNHNHVDRLPPLVLISRRLLRDHVLCCPDGRYMCDLLMRRGETVYSSRGVVCLVLELGPEPTNDQGRQRKEIQTAFRQGLLDNATKSKADFRVRIKSLHRKLAALQDAEYLPEDAWRVDVVFANWLEHQSNKLISSPFDPDPVAFDTLEIKFVPRSEWSRFPLGNC